MKKTKKRTRVAAATSPKHPTLFFKRAGAAGQVGGWRNKIKVVVAMSGGIDSSVAAALLKKQGYNVIGVFMKFWAPRGGAVQIYTDKKTDLHGFENRCCTPESEKRARLVAEKLGIPFYVFNFEKEFKKKVVDYFLKEEKDGKTPNPCVVCNKEIKFGLLLEKALKLNADFVATGHYARIKTQNSKRKIQSQNSKLKTFKLLKAKDGHKDQSYFLWRLSQKQLSRILFPVGNYRKDEVRRLAGKFRLPVADVKESMEVCFVLETIESFLKKYLEEKPGIIVDIKGNKMGEHQGLWFYTIGQRRGLKICGGPSSASLRLRRTGLRGLRGIAGKPWYVADKDIKKNLLIVTQNEKDLYKKELIAKDINWIYLPKFHKAKIRVKAQIRYRHKPVSATIMKKRGGKIKVIFSKKQKAITPGQSVVFYSPSQVFEKNLGGQKGQELLGGGIIL